MMSHVMKNIAGMIRNLLPLLIVFLLIFSQPSRIEGQVFRGYYSNGAEKFKLKKNKKRQIIRGYYPSGALEFTATYKKGELDGIVREYFENGMLKAEIPYKENRRHGLAKFYYENGMLMGKIAYKRGNETGEAKFYDEKGLLSSSTPRLKRRLRRAKKYESVNSTTDDNNKTKEKH